MKYLKPPQFRYSSRTVSGYVRASISALLFTALASTPALAQDDDDDMKDEEVVKLSTFSVNADTYQGYVASSTLIGGKTAQQIPNN